MKLIYFATWLIGMAVLYGDLGTHDATSAVFHAAVSLSALILFRLYDE